MRTLAFAKRNFLEMIRDPLSYVFCLGFPVGMLALFACLNGFQGAPIAVFSLLSLVPGVMMFSFTFVMLITSLLISKDRQSAFLRRLYTSPMKPADFVFGYALPCTAIGILQACVCMLTGWVLALVGKEAYFGVGEGILLLLSQIPMLLICVFFGIFFGTALNEKASPGVSSILISASGVLGGAWMPLDTMGDFEKICRFLPFYPSVSIGRIFTHAAHTLPNAAGETVFYVFDQPSAVGVAVIALYLALAVFSAIWQFKRQMQE